MSDRPTNDNSEASDQTELKGGWQKPSTPGGWRTPTKEPEAPETGGWRVVQALPADLEQTPQQSGIWHLPKPEDTIFTPEDEIKIGASGTEVVTGGESAAAEAQPATYQVEMVAHPAATPEAEEEEIEPQFSMSELVALASLVEDQPQVEVLPGEQAPSPEQTLASEAGAETEAPDDPGAYARRQLEALERASQSAPAAPAPAPTGSTGSNVGVGIIEPATSKVETGATELDPGEYARRQLEQLAGQPAAPVAVEPAAPAAPAVVALTPEQEELARRFRDVEDQVRALKRRYEAGELSREDLQAQLRTLMQLDNDQKWWMMGIETDTWYRFENGEWLAATPPHATQRMPAAPDTGAFTAAGIGQGSLPYLADDDSQEQVDTLVDGDILLPVTQPIAVINVDDMPLPRQVPRIDPDLTQVNQVAIDQNTRLSYGAETVPNVYQVPDVTIANPVVQDYTYVESPITEADVVPDYDIDDDDRSVAAQQAIARQRASLGITLLRIAGIAIVLLLGAFICGALLVVSQYQGIAGEWQDEIAGLASYEPDFQTARILDARGDEIAELDSPEGGARTQVPLSQISPFMIHAVISLENERFYDDPGWDPVAIARAFLQNVGSGEIESGASTITQQIARQLVLQDTTVSAERKLAEIIIAAEIGKIYSKNEILELYLNEVYFGNQAYGVEAAAEFYFDNSAADLTLPQAAFLAGLLAAPATYDPVPRENQDNREVAFDRMDAVVAKMAEVGCLQFQHSPYLEQPFCVTQAIVSSGQFALDKARVETHEFVPRQYLTRYPHFVTYIQAQLERDYGPGEIFRRGFTVQTTLIPEIQDTAQEALENQINAVRQIGVTTGSIMVTDPRDGAIRAMVGSPDFNDETNDGQVNGALTWQSPGSSIKPIVYTAAFEGVDRNGNGAIDGNSEYYNPATILWDVPTNYSTGQPIRNFDGQFHGPQAIRFALANSYNIPAVKTYDFIGTQRFVDTAQRMGLRFLQEAQFNSTTAIGGTDVRLYDMMSAYGTLANDGVRVPLYSIISVTDSAGTELPLAERAAPAQAVQPQIAFLLQSILSDDNARAEEFGLNSALTISGFPGLVAAKTGTSNDARDLWTMGFTNNVVVGVWMGRADNRETQAQSGFQVVVPVWNTVMTRSLRTIQGIEPFNPPSGVVALRVCGLTGTQADASCANQRNEFFAEPFLPPPPDQAFVVSLTVDTWSGLRANEFCPSNIEQRTFVNITDTTAVAWLQSPAGANVAAALGLPAGLPVAPTAACDISTPQ
ncbi:MAG: penicillin-binding protein, partial [Burkholderiales bacterium]|nr:penicillin-binding protein [Anaerolineae bacterium]